jgi:hypothetical protein
MPGRRRPSYRPGMTKPRILTVLLSLIGTVALTLAGAATSSSTAASDPGADAQSATVTHYYSLRSRVDNRAVATHFLGAFGGTWLEAYIPRSRMDWTFRTSASGVGLEIVNRLAGTCLEAPDLSDDSVVLHRPCTGSSRQAWNIVFPQGPDHNPSLPFVAIRNAWNGKALTVGLDGWGGTPLVQHSWTGWNPVVWQQFELRHELAE